MSNAKKEFHDRVVKRHLSGIYKEVSGYYVLWLQGQQGYLNAQALRVLADELDKRNADWDKVVKSANSKGDTDG